MRKYNRVQQSIGRTFTIRPNRFYIRSYTELSQKMIHMFVNKNADFLDYYFSKKIVDEN